MSPSWSSLAAIIIYTFNVMDTYSEIMLAAMNDLSLRSKFLGRIGWVDSRPLFARLVVLLIEDLAGKRVD